MKEMIILLLMLAAGLCFQTWLLLKPERVRVRKIRADRLKDRREEDG